MRKFEAAGVTEHLWEICDIVKLTKDAEPKPGPRSLQEADFKLRHYP